MRNRFHGHDQIDGLVQNRFSRLFDVSGMRGSTLFNDSLGSNNPEDKDNKEIYELFRLEVLSALLFNEQLLIPQVSTYIGPVVTLFGEIRKAADSVSGQLPLVAYQPFRVSMEPQWCDRGNDSVFHYLIAELSKDAAAKRVGNSELDKNPDVRPEEVRRAVSLLCQAIIDGNITSEVRAALEVAFQDKADAMLKLFQSYQLSPPAQQTPLDGNFGTRVHGFLSEYWIRASLIETGSSPKVQGSHAVSADRIESFLRFLRADPALERRGQLTSERRYLEFSDCVGALNDVWGFVLHQELAQRIRANRTVLETLPVDRNIGPILKKKPTLAAERVYAYEGRNFSSADKERLLGLKDSNWGKVWQRVFRYMNDSNWAGIIESLRKAQIQGDRALVVAETERIANEFIADLGDEILQFNLYSPSEIKTVRALVKGSKLIGSVIQRGILFIRIHNGEIHIPEDTQLVSTIFNDAMGFASQKIETAYSQRNLVSRHSFRKYMRGQGWRIELPKKG